jgi:di-heme cytochrome c peroxidase
MNFQLHRRTGVACAAAVGFSAGIGLLIHSSWAQARPPDRSGSAAISLDCDPNELSPPDSERCRTRRRLEGQRLFEEETFGGNGRTCVTCHSRKTGTFSPADAQARLAANPNDPVFTHDGLDDGFSGTSRIEQHATVRITLPLPSHLTLADDPTATHVTFNRSTPTTKNTPALDPALMWDLRAANLEVQALGAIHGHAQNTIEPTPLQLELIAEFQRISSRFFSDGRPKKFARTGVPPELPQGRSNSEKRGRLFFVDAPFEPPGKVGVCALCHSGPMLNQANAFSSAVFGNPPGARLFTIGVSEANFIGNPTRTFLVHDGLGAPLPVTTPDIGVLMSNPATSPFAAIPPPPVLKQLGLRLAFFANTFKVPPLWGVKDTAPYFHDNSAKDFDEMLGQYDWFFLSFAIGGRIMLTPQDKEDIKAFLNLL